jgi:hypothetical protein
VNLKLVCPIKLSKKDITASKTTVMSFEHGVAIPKAAVFLMAIWSFPKDIEL